MKKFKLGITRTSSILLTLICCSALCGCGSPDFSSASSDSSYLSDSSSSSSAESALYNGSLALENIDSSMDSVSTDDGPWLPDPYNVLGARGEYYETAEDKGGIYDLYVYDYNTSIDEMGSSIVTYGEALEELGYNVKKLSLTTDNEVYAQAYEKDGYQAEIGVFVAGANDTSHAADEDDIISWRVVLAVPEGMSFEPGDGTPGVTNGHTTCEACGGSKKCPGCFGSGRANYGDGYETCVICGGERICNVCDGLGYY